IKLNTFSLAIISNGQKSLILHFLFIACHLPLAHLHSISQLSLILTYLSISISPKFVAPGSLTFFGCAILDPLLIKFHPLYSVMPLFHISFIIVNPAIYETI